MLVVGIDQGSSHTRAAVADTQGNILGWARAEGACHSIHGMDVAMRAVRDAVEGALSTAGTNRDDIAVLFGGLTGADWPEEYDLLADNLKQLGFSQNVGISNDAMIGMRAGTSQPYGAVLAVGTGANCGVRTPSGEEWLYHYYVEDDLQGGSALGQRALRAIYRAHTQREPETSLIPAVLDLFSFQSVDDLLRADIAGQMRTGQLKDIAPLVLQAAAGDTVAGRIVADFGDGLGELVTILLTRFDMQHINVEVVFSGSVLRDNVLVETVTRRIQRGGAAGADRQRAL